MKTLTLTSGLYMKPHTLAHTHVHTNIHTRTHTHAHTFPLDTKKKGPVFGQET